LTVSVKRLNYFKHQFLEEQDFKDEQAYHVESRRRHNRLLHSWGVAEGLEVRRKGDREVVIDTGTAYDRHGREIVLEAPVTHDVSRFIEHSTLYVTIGYKDDPTDRRSGAGEGHTRITEGALIDCVHEPPQDGSVIPLAHIHLDEASRHIRHVEMEIPLRRRAGGQVSPVFGWLRLPFKPVRMERMRVGGRLVPTLYKDRDVEADFIVDVASAYCGDRGARGTMAVPPPPGASRVRAFRIAGETSGSVQMELFRTGWNLEEKRSEETLLIKETVSDASFHKRVAVKEELQYLNPESHTLALSVVAEGKTTIWLVAAQFE
jgi:hypothetical protein